MKRKEFEFVKKPAGYFGCQPIAGVVLEAWRDESGWYGRVDACYMVTVVGPFPYLLRAEVETTKAFYEWLESAYEQEEPND